MYKVLSCFVCWILLISLIVSLSFSVLAEDFDSSVLGTDDDMTGYFVEETADKDKLSRAVILPDLIDPGDGWHDIFSITAVHVEELLVSHNTNKWFKRNSLPEYAKSILCRANLNHSLYGDVEMIGRLDCAISCGVCERTYSTMYDSYIYESVGGMSIPYYYIGQYCEETFSIAQRLDYDTQYYAYVKNNYPAGYIYGTFELYWIES